LPEKNCDFSEKMCDFPVFFGSLFAVLKTALQKIAVLKTGGFKPYAKKNAVFKTARLKICGFETANQNRTLTICGFKPAR
jgi:hypothetical protein